MYTPHFYQGVTIDARLAFQQPDLEWFTATVEATPVDRAHEVLYRTNWFRIGALSALAGWVAVAIGLALTQVQSFNVWQWTGARPALGLLVLVWVLVAASTAVSLMGRASFRYVYAIEQFKLFYADAQWIAYDPEIFVGNRKAFNELQRQCILGGFGMMEILEGNRVRDVIEPSHLDQFQGRRSRLPLWVAAVQPPPKLKSLVRRLPFPSQRSASRTQPTKPTASSAPSVAPTSPTDGNTDPLTVGAYLPAKVRLDDYAKSLIRAQPGRPKWYRQPGRRLTRLRWQLRQANRKLYPPEIRRRPGYYDLPWWYLPTLAVSLVAIVTLAAIQSSYRPTARPGGAFEVPDVVTLEPAAAPEASLATPYLLPGEYDHDFSSATAPVAAEGLPPTRDLVVDAPVRQVMRYRIDKAGEIRLDYDCVNYYNSSSSFYLLTTGAFPDLPAARTEADRLHAVYGLAATAVAEECVRPGGGAYLVYVARPVVEEAQVNFLVREYVRRFELVLEVLLVE